MAKNKDYKKIIEFLSKRRFATRQEISKSLDISSGGGLTDLLVDLEKSGFIQTYRPFDASPETLLTRYCIADNYLQFYTKFIKPIAKRIKQGDFDLQPRQAIHSETYSKWLGFAFERWCRSYHRVIAKILGFSAFSYQTGAYFSRSTESDHPGFQIDLAFDRADHVLTVCEVKYHKGKIRKNVIHEFEKKISILEGKTKRTIHKVLICNEGIEPSLRDASYFDHVITGDDLFDPANWR